LGSCSSLEATSRRPHRSLLCPGALRVALFELLGRIVQGRGIAAALVLRNAGPVESLRRGIAFGQGLDDVAEAALGFFPLLASKCRVRQTELKLRQEVIGRQEPFEAMALGSVRIEDNDRGRPLRAEALEGLRLFFDVDLHRQEVVADEALNAGIGINLSIQPSASSSHGSSIEIEQQWGVLLARLAERGVNVFQPLDWHKTSRKQRRFMVAPGGEAFNAGAEEIGNGNPALGLQTLVRY